MADLDEIMSGRDDASVQTETPAIEQAEQTRDEQGRFAAGAQQPEQQASPVEAPPATDQRAPDGFVPIQALDARLAKQQERFEAQLRDREDAIRREMMQHIQQPQRQPEAPKPPPDIFENPEEAIRYYVQQAIAPVQQSSVSQKESVSQMMAVDKFGEETVSSAFSEMQKRMQTAPQSVQFEYQRIMASPHPYGELVKWHKTQSAMQTYGDDPTAYREKLRAEIVAEMQQHQQPAPQAQTGQQVMPTPFANARNAGPASPPAYTGPRPLSDIMGGR